MKIDSKTKGPQILCIPHGGWGLVHECKSRGKKHAGADKKLSVELYSWSAPSKQSTSGPLKQEIVGLLAC